MSGEELPKGWEWATPPEVSENCDSRRVPLNGKQRETRKGPYPYYGANGQVDSIDDFIYEGDYVLVAEDGGFFDDPIKGVSYIASGKFWVNNHAHILKPLAGVSTAFLRFAFNQVKWQGHISGTTRAKLTQSALNAVNIPCPPLPEQRRIVEKIEALTARSRRAKEALDAIPALLDRYRQSVLAAAFRGDLTADWREDYPELDAATDRTVVELVAEPIRNGLSVRGSDNPPGIPALKLSALRHAEVDMNDVRYLQITNEQASRYLLRQGDVLISRGNGTKRLVACASIVPAFRTPSIFPDTAFRLRLKAEQVNSHWFALIWNAPQVREQIEGLAKTTAGIWKVSQADITKVVLRVPSVFEQVETVRRMRRAFTIERLLATARKGAAERLATLDQSILAKAFRGELVPQDPNDEPASVLLERIRRERAAAGTSPKRGRRPRK